jgi:hypothetical protein
MCTPIQLDHDLFRILLYRKDAAEILLEACPNGLHLPTVPIPSHTRIAEQITAAIKSSWHLDACCLFPLSCTESSTSQLRYQVLEIWQIRSDPPAGMRWLPIDSVLTVVSEDDADFRAVQDSLKKIAQYRRGELPGPFAKPGWLETVTAWVKDQAAKIHLSLTGEIRQLNASPTFSLIRFETDGSALWFKAVGEPNLHEYPITMKLANTFPEFVPHILGSRPEWNAWLSLETEGSHLDTNSPGSAWEAAAENLALLQVASLGRGFELIGTGCRDLRPPCLIDLVGPFIEATIKLMERQARVSPPSLSRLELRSLGSNIASSLKQFADTVPNALGHLDMNGENLLLCGVRCVFLDWAEAFVGPAFFTFHYLIEHRRRVHGTRSADLHSLVASYTQHWRRNAAPGEIALALRLTPLLAAFTYAAASRSWRDLEIIRPETAALLRSLTRHMSREAAALSQRNLACVP